MTDITKKCLWCNTTFIVNVSRKKIAKYCSTDCHNKSMTNQTIKPFSKEHKKRISKAVSGEKNHNWMGDNVNYGGAHAWIRRHYKKPKKCSSCGKITKTEWANKDHTYSRKIEDYMSMCRSCHMKYDIKKGLRRKSRLTKI